MLRRKLASEPLEVSEPTEDNTFDSPDALSIDVRVPPKIMRLTQHLHNLIYIRFFYEQIGQQPPDWIKRQMVRAEVDLKEEIESEENQGGSFHTRDKGERR